MLIVVVLEDVTLFALIGGGMLNVLIPVLGGGGILKDE
jgi:hypothetical protein